MEFIEKLKITFRENNIEVLEFTNEKDFIKYKCLDCGEVYSFKCARNLLSRITLCKKCYNPFNRWNKERLLNFKIKRLYPNSKIEILSFNSLRRGGEIKCLKCGETEIINNFEAVFSARKEYICNKCEKEKDKIYKNLILEIQKNNLELISWEGVNSKAKFKCLRCGHIFEKFVKSNFNSKICPNCFKVANKIDFKNAQEILDKKSPNEYVLLEYENMNKRSLIRHKCGFCFSTRLSDFKTSRGCPKCYSKMSKGEQKIKTFLEKENIDYIYQKRFSDLKKFSFDFCIYLNNKMILLEYQGEQHYNSIEIFDSLKITQERDNIKKEYCLINNIPLIEIPYWEYSNIEQFLQLKFNDYLEKE